MQRPCFLPATNLKISYLPCHRPLQLFKAKQPEEYLSECEMGSEELKTQWLLQNEKICICKGIPRKRFMDAMAKGASSLQEVNRIVGSGSGDCKGERCGPRIERLLAEYQHDRKNKKNRK